MKVFTSVFIIFFYSFLLTGQDSGAKYSRVKVDLTTTKISAIAKLGLEADHGVYAKGRHLINDFSKKEIALLKANNINFEILIEDVQAYYIAQNEGHSHEGHEHGAGARSGGDCGAGVGPAYDYVTPANYEFGSMGGYYTYDELLTELDEMAALYPNLISAKEPVENITTHEGRPIYWLRLSDNPNVEEDEPEVFYNAAHHAREANSVSQLVFYLWYLLENYETNPEVKYLVDNTEMYFMPCVNPDGYIYNETTDPNGGGLWRKNRRDNDDGTFGVDLNRNYGFEWGFDDTGSSPETGNQTYRGPSSFSEPETQAVRDFCNLHEFQITLNYHSFGNLLIYPWGYSDQVTNDDPTFSAFADVMTKENNFLAGTGTETVGYTVNGDSDDWMYGETTTKPRIFSMTPEVGPGNFGFWPPQSAIDELNKSTLLQNLTTAHLLLNYGEAAEQNSSNNITAYEGTLDMAIKKYGLQIGDLTLNVTGIGTKVTVTPNNNNSWSLDHLEEENIAFDYTVSNDAVDGEIIRFLVEVDNGLFVLSDTLDKTFLAGDITNIFSEDGADTGLWTVSNGWATTTADFVSSPSSITDSPNGDYDGNINSTIILQEEIDLENATQAILTFHAKWAIEAAYDYVQVMASTNGGATFNALCGKYTKIGNGDQDEGEPLYDGTQTDWVLEEIDLNDCLGEKVILGFRIVSDGFVEFDGFYFDDLEVNAVVADNTSALEGKAIVNDFRVFPNPFKESLVARVNLSQPAEHLSLQLVNALGQTLRTKALADIASGNHQLTFEEEGLTEGIYFLQLYVDGIMVETEKVVKRK
jgi:carboxypeptidase T